MVISGNTRLIAHLGYPTASFKAPMIYNPWFVDQQVDRWGSGRRTTPRLFRRCLR